MADTPEQAANMHMRAGLMQEIAAIIADNGCLRALCSACQMSYAACTANHDCADLPSAAAGRSAMSVLMPALPFSIRDNL
jgi:hypothetical protein